MKVFDIILPNLDPKPEDKTMAKNKQSRSEIYDFVIVYKKQFIIYTFKRKTLKMIKIYVSWKKT